MKFMITKIFITWLYTMIPSTTGLNCHAYTALDSDRPHGGVAPVLHDLASHIFLKALQAKYNSADINAVAMTPLHIALNPCSDSHSSVIFDNRKMDFFFYNLKEYCRTVSVIDSDFVNEEE